LTQQKTRLIEQRAKLVEKHGLDKITVDPRTDQVKKLHADLAECLQPLVELCRGMEAAGISFDDLPRLFENPDDPAPAEPEPAGVTEPETEDVPA
jgi:hypothetical protein